MSQPAGSSASRTYRGLAPEERQAQRRQKLLEAGKQRIGTVGYAATTVDAVCADAGVAKRHFYEHFPHLDDLLIAVYRDTSGTILRGVADALVSTDDIVEAACAGIEAFFTALDADRLTARIMLAEVLGVSTEVEQAYRAVIDEWVGIIEAALATVDYRGVPTTLLADTAWGLITGAAVRWLLTGFRAPCADVVTTVQTVIRDVLGRATPVRT